MIKTRNKIFAEIGGGSDKDNTFVLRQWKGWKGLLFNSGRYFMGGQSQQILINVMVTPSEVLKIFRDYKVAKDLDYLSVDIDGNDYWVTKEILKEYKPAVVSV